ncbi:MAG: hypothetical protein CMP48_09320 [Rickettsiales bacterium]|nr:hypothetical protein [Rickettsiales bacterium]
MDIFLKDNLTEAKRLSLELLDEAKDNNDRYHLTKIYYLLGYICEYTDDFGNSIIYYLEGARYGLMSGDERLKADVISIHKNVATLLADYKHFDLAHRFLNEGLNLAREVNNEKQIISFLSNRVFLYLDQEMFEEAIHEIAAIRENHIITPERNVILLNKLGWAQQSLGLYEEASRSYKEVIQDTTSIGLKVYAISLQNLALIKSNEGNYKEALKHLQESINYCKEFNYPRWLLRSYSDIGSIYFNHGNIDQSIKYFNLGIALVENGDQDAESYEIFNLASQAYQSIGNLDLALINKELYSTRLEQYIEQQKEIAELGQLYNIQLLTDRYYDLLAADMEQKRTEKLAKFGIGGTASFFLIILSVVVYRQKRMKITLARELHELELHSEV